MEVWKPVVGHEGSYEVSDLGRVRTVEHTVVRCDGRSATIKPRILKLQPHPRFGYVYVGLGRKFRYRVHKLVMDAFVGPRPAGMETRHLDGDRANNCLANLTYGTWHENFDDRRRHGTDNAGERHPLAKLSEADAVDILWLSGWGVKDRLISEMFSVNTESVRRIRVGERWAHLQ